MNLPSDPLMLMSILNTKLRDFYPDLHALCQDLELSEPEILQRMQQAGYSYNSERNQFCRKQG